MRYAGRPDARRRQAVIEKSRDSIAEVLAHRRLNRGDHLQQDEDDADRRQWKSEPVAALHRGHQHTHGNCEQCRQDSVQQHDGPPPERKNAVGLRDRRHRRRFSHPASAPTRRRILPATQGTFVHARRRIRRDNRARPA
jgi:hypothetical protein